MFSGKSLKDVEQHLKKLKSNYYSIASYYYDAKEKKMYVIERPDKNTKLELSSDQQIASLNNVEMETYVDVIYRNMH
jgi:hypothetical protein